MPQDRETADVVAEAVLACPAVAALGGDGIVATFLPGRRVEGVRVRDDVCEVAVALRSDGRPIPELAEEVRRAAAAVLDGRAVDVLVVDLVTEAEENDAESGAGTGPESAAGADAGPSRRGDSTAGTSGDGSSDESAR